MEPSYAESAVISHNKVIATTLRTTARRTSPMQQELNTVAIDLDKKVFHMVGNDTTGNVFVAQAAL